VLAGALLDMAQTFNTFYQKVRILDGDARARAPRLSLAECLRQVLAEGLCLLGLKAPLKM
jgi:arginyl-tRNA synthetase